MPVILQDYGIACDLFDPLYAPERPDRSFDLITSTETFEHFRDPHSAIHHIVSLLTPGGLLCVMTGLWTELHRFPTWSYTRDVTHICFYHADTFRWIAQTWGLEILHQDGRRVVCLRKPENRHTAISEHITSPNIDEHKNTP